jgi:hypothetical protein
MCALHGAQMPRCLRAFVQIDTTPEVSDPTIDKVLGATKAVTRIIMLMKRLGLPDPIFGAAARTLPPAEGRQLLETSFGSATSMRNALAELDLLGEFRAAIGGPRDMPPRLVISAGKATQRSGVLARLLASPEKARAIAERMEQLHRQHAAKNGHWTNLPYTHGDLVFDPAGARATSAAVLEFVRSLT